MDLKSTLSSGFALFTFLILSGVCVFQYDYFDMRAIISMMYRIVPATVVMGILGRMMGSILDKPKNLADSDYQSAVMSELKKIDKNMTMAELSKKLSPEVELPPEEIQVELPNGEDAANKEKKSE